MPAPTRKQRLESLLYREIATIVQRDLQDPRLTLVTITRVEMTADLHQVKAFFTVLGGTGQRNAVQRALDQAKGFVQRAYAPAVRTRLLPQLSFAYDDREERRNEMDELIRRARATDRDGGEAAATEQARIRSEADAAARREADADEAEGDASDEPAGEAKR